MNTGKILTLCLRTESTEFKGSLTNVSGSEIELKKVEMKLEGNHIYYINFLQS